MHILMQLVMLVGVLFGVFGLAAGQQWNPLGQDIDGEAEGDYSGMVSMSEDGYTVAIGAWRHDEKTGHVRVYSFNTANDSWEQRGGDIDGEAAGDQSGVSVSLSADGSIVAVGADRNDGDIGDMSGHVRVYSFNTADESWVQRGGDIDGEAANDRSGISVSLSADGSTIAIGAYRNGDDNGHVRVYSYDESAWNKVGQDIDGEAANDVSGKRVSLSADGSIVAVGATGNDEMGDSSGHVRVYSLNGNQWVQLGEDINGEAAGDRSGESVSLSADGSIVAIGAHYNDGDNGDGSGHVRVYSLNGNQWVQLGGDIDGEAANDGSGFSVSLSADGLTVAIGAYRNGDNERGHVRVYSLNGNQWVQLGQDIDGEAAGDNSGLVSLSADGSTVAVGAANNIGNGGTNSGHVRVYSLCGPGKLAYKNECRDICPPGRYTKTGICVKCPLGKYAAAEGSAECEQCPAGSFADAEESAQCTPCAAGSWTSGSNRIACTDVVGMLTNGGFADLADVTAALASYGEGRTQMKSAYSNHCPA